MGVTCKSTRNCKPRSTAVTVKVGPLAARIVAFVPLNFAPRPTLVLPDGSASVFEDNVSPAITVSKGISTT